MLLSVSVIGNDIFGGIYFVACWCMFVIHDVYTCCGSGRKSACVSSISSMSDRSMPEEKVR